MSALAFEDVHQYDGSTYYLVPNEDPLIWRELVKGLHVQRAAAICSSGEVGLFSILPTVRKELVLVDHSYKSLAIAMAKYVVIKKVGVKKARELFTSTDGEALKKALKEALAECPEVVAKNAPLNVFVRVRYERVISRDAWGTYETYNYNKSTESTAKELITEWSRTPARLISCAAAKLDKVSFIHGDLSDLEAKGPFDLLYISNAHQHVSRNKTSPMVKEILKSVKPGGYLLACGDDYGLQLAANRTQRQALYNVFTAVGCEVVKNIKGKYDTSNRIAWQHTLYKTPAKEA